MATPYLVTDCPRCGANRITFDTIAHNKIGSGYVDWQARFEVPAVCRECMKTTVWIVEVNNINWAGPINGADLWRSDINLAGGIDIDGYVSLKDAAGLSAPEFVPAEIKAIFDEAATCNAVGCSNASAAMSRLCLDTVTKRLLPSDGATGPLPNAAQRNRLFDRLDWLFSQGTLPPDLRELADTIRQHGNDGAHDGNCEQIDAEDLLDFTSSVLERIYTLPERVRLARQRSIDRRKPPIP